MVVVALLASRGLAQVSEPPPNLLVLVADDMGVDRVAAYGLHPDPGRTPVIDDLAAHGVLFRNAWSTPFCSASRAAVLTGRHGFRTGIGTFLVTGASAGELPRSEFIVPRALAPLYRNAAVGKWHLSNDPAHPLALGFEHHRGSIGNIPETDPDPYFTWQKCVDGVVTQSTTYATTDAVDDALAFIAEFSADPEQKPWFLWVAFNAPHKPYHHPPASLITQPLPASPTPADDPAFMKALAEAMDTEIGRLLASMDPAVRARTIVVFMGDNGTQQSATTAPFLPSHAKGTIYQGGVNVPLVVSGPGVAEGAICDALVGFTDLFATFTDLAGLDVPDPEDSLSFAPLLAHPELPSPRTTLYTERFDPDLTVLTTERRQALRDARHKLWRVETKGVVTEQKFFDLLSDPFEKTDLLAAGPLSGDALAAYDALVAQLDATIPVPDWTDTGWGTSGATTMLLAGSGELAPGGTITVSLSGGVPDAPVFLFVGLHYLLWPVFGCTIVPTPDLLFTFAADPLGGFALQAPWPPGIPAGTTIHYQVFQKDPTGPKGVTTSNGLRSHVP